ncbi:MAG: protein-L-isoaspartate O-methyltransferase [Mariprofundaceae bacterium]
MSEVSNHQATLEVARRNMVEYQIRCCKVLDSKLLDMLDTMPREDFVPQDVRSLAYMEGRVPIDADQEMLSPLQEASILQQLDLKGDERILEIGAGTGYLTTLLAMTGGQVCSCELQQGLTEKAQKNLSDHGIENAKVIHINAMNADEMQQSSDIGHDYDVIVIGASLTEIPSHISDLLSKNGQLIAFIGQNPIVTLTHIQRQGSTSIKTGLFETLLQDMQALPENRQFIF